MTTLYSRRENVLNQRFPYIATALQNLPNETVIDGELVALGPDGRPEFHLLQNYRSAESRIVYYAFDILVHEGRRLTESPLSERRAILSSVVEPGEHVALSQVSKRPAAEMLRFVKSHGLEGAVAKRSDSLYQPGQRTGLWSKYRVDLGQDFVVGGYVGSNLDSGRGRTKRTPSRRERSVRGMFDSLGYFSSVPSGFRLSPQGSLRVLYFGPF